MKKIMLLVGFIIFIIILTKIDPSLSFTRTGGIVFESSTPPVVSNFKTENVLDWFESVDEKPSIDKHPLYTSISGSDIHLQLSNVDVEFYFGQELSNDFLLANDFPKQIVPIFHNKGEDKIVAVKVTYLDLTNQGVKRLEKLMLSDSKLTLNNQSEFSPLNVFKYQDYLIFLKGNVLYYVLYSSENI